MSWNPSQVISKLWPVVWARPLLILAAVLWVPLLVGGLILAANTAMHALGTSVTFAGLSALSHWSYLGLSVEGLIALAVLLGMCLMFWAAARPEAVTVTEKRPEGANVTSQHGEPRVNIHAPDNQGTIIGVNQGQVHVGREPRLTISPWSVTRLPNGSYQGEATLTSDIPTTLPRVTFIARSPSLLELTVTPNGGIGFGYLDGTVDGGRFVSFANVTPPYRIRTVSKEPEPVNFELSSWNPLDG